MRALVAFVAAIVGAGLPLRGVGRARILRRCRHADRLAHRADAAAQDRSRPRRGAERRRHRARPCDRGRLRRRDRRLPDRTREDYPMINMGVVKQTPSANYSDVQIAHDLFILHLMEGGYLGSVAWLCRPEGGRRPTIARTPTGPRFRSSCLSTGRRGRSATSTATGSPASIPALRLRAFRTLRSARWRVTALGLFALTASLASTPSAAKAGAIVCITISASPGAAMSTSAARRLDVADDRKVHQGRIRSARRRRLAVLGASRRAGASLRRLAAVRNAGADPRRRTVRRPATVMIIRRRPASRSRRARTCNGDCARSAQTRSSESPEPTTARRTLRSGRSSAPVGFR